MKSYIDVDFLALYQKLPRDIQHQARAAYQRFRQDPQHPGLHFKRVHTREPVYSARVNQDYRVLGLLAGNEITWFWIGDHDAYLRLLNTL